MVTFDWFKSHTCQIECYQTLARGPDANEKSSQTNFRNGLLLWNFWDMSLTQPHWHTRPTAYVKIHNAMKLHCRLDFFTYRNLFQNEVSNVLSSKSLVNLLIQSNAHIHYYRSIKNWMNFGAWNQVPVVFKLNSTGNIWDRNLWPVLYQI